MSRRALLIGAALVAAYVAAALVLPGARPVRPIFDGLAPPAPYKWVSPPPDIASGNSPPASAGESLPLKSGGTDETSVATADGQATLILPQGAFTASVSNTSVRIDITPKDPARYGSPPSRLSYSGNAYEMRATYEPSGTSATPALNVTVLLSYPITATQIVLRSGSGWTTVPTTSVAASLQVFAKTKSVGVFAAVGPGTSNSLRWWTLGIASGIAAVLGLAFGLRERRRLAHGSR